MRHDTDSTAALFEQFELSGTQLTRELGVNGTLGRSSLNLGTVAPGNGSEDSLKNAWDRATLNGIVPVSTPAGKSQPIRIADLFCGVGGLSLGVSQAIRAAGFEAHRTLAADVDTLALNVYRRNHDPKHIEIADLWTATTRQYSSSRGQARFTVTPRVVPGHSLEMAIGEVDLLLGGPPCEGHSNFNNVTRRNDDRNRLYIVMPAIAMAVGARVVVVENVSGVRHDRSNVLQTAKELFESGGYFVDETVVNGIEIGLAQTRKRHILVASRDKQPNIAAAAEVLERRPRSLEWPIRELLDINGAEDGWDTVNELSETNRDRINYLFDNGEYDLPNFKRPKSHANGHTYPSVYGRLHWDEPAGTITTGYQSPGRGRFIHPQLRRTLTAHEAARIQGFPESYEFKLIDGSRPNRSQLAKLIGNAVPPPLAFVAGVAALAATNLEAG